MSKTAAAEVLGAVVAVILAVACWNAGVEVHRFAAVADGAPEFESASYSGSWIAGATVLVVVAGVLAVDAARRSLLIRSHTR
ncbi:hypothetical protein [Rhodococcoides yunnanense]|uniref:hypothetical protein n=1 Tax=Rhodococcoides yunnanense TaxID=278209 RepID=UPI000932E4EE|nr:hypothetical protein [Rhodococcus yunnanensis]